MSDTFRCPAGCGEFVRELRFLGGETLLVDVAAAKAGTLEAREASIGVVAGNVAFEIAPADRVGYLVRVSPYLYVRHERTCSNSLEFDPIYVAGRAAANSTREDGRAIAAGE